MTHFAHWPERPLPFDHRISNWNALFEKCLDLPAGGDFDAKRLPCRGGVYLLVDAENRPILLACCENLRRVVPRRLTAAHTNKPSRRPDFAAVARRLFWRETFSSFETSLVHWRLARTLYPLGYRNMLRFGPAWFLRVDLGASHPQFNAVVTVADDGADYVGPIATRRQAEAWIAMLEDAFDLCRYRHILEQAPHGEACAYYYMGKCPAPCNGTITMEQYRGILREALEFSLGRREPRISALRARMEEAARRLAYERAASLRETLSRVGRTVDRAEYRHLSDARSAAWLVLQRASPRRRVSERALIRAYYVRFGHIEITDAVSLNRIEEALPRWIAMAEGSSRRLEDAKAEGATRSEALWLLAKSLFQGVKAPGLSLRIDVPQLSPQRCTEAIRDRFLEDQPS